MEIKFTIKIKNKHNAPVFNEELGKGVLATYTIDYKGVTEENIKNNPMLLTSLIEKSEEIMRDWIEVTYETV